MSRVKLTIATTDYDHFPRFSSRYCQGGGHRSYRLTLGHHEIFARFTFNREWDASELTMCRTLARGSPLSTTRGSALPIGGPGRGYGPTEFLAPHGLAGDSHGDLYVGEVSWTNWPQTFRDKPRPDNLRSLHKFRKVA